MKLCVIGVGRLGSALLQGWKKTDWALSALGKHGVPREVKEVTFKEAIQADIVVVAVKPKDVASVLQELFAHGQSPGPLIVSVAVQPDLQTLQAHAPQGAAVARAMPNIACAVGKSVTAYACGRHVSSRQQIQLQALWDACGQGILVEENQLAAATALSGCGPAYAFRFIQSLTRAGEQMGLEKTQSEQMARGILQGAAGLLEKEPEKPLVQWIDQVATPGGTTEAALKKWGELEFDRVVLEGLAAAYMKNKTRGQK
ncbi:pyrroline-5-carboxylate reductase [Candidatus Micrarchaeota archaeon]|nr:pyrroline-5-carboxylate reductase [Candidatus Micrarchaeota archaeon]